MSRPFDPQSKSFGSLLGQYEETRQIVVPDFQRPYSWEKEHISTFWVDLREFRQEKKKTGIGAKRYFIGPIVTLPEGENLLLLDGQQRLATATIVFSVLRDAATGIATRSAQDLAGEIQRDLIARDRTDTKFALQLGEMDRDFFKRVIQKKNPERRSAKIRSHRLIEMAQKFFAKEIQTELQGSSSKKQIKILEEIKITLATAVTMVAIEVGSEDDAYHIFETLNDRGVKLTVPDLVLNLLLRKAPGKQARREIKDTWNELVEEIAHRDIDKFLRHMWLSQYGDVKTRSLFLEIKNHVAASGLTTAKFATSCRDECKHYVKITNADPAELGKRTAVDVDAIVRRLGAENALPVLLSAHRCLDASAFAKVAKLTLTIAIRFKVLTDLSPYTLESAFYTTARVIRQLKGKGKSDAYIANQVKDAFQAINPDDQTIVKSSARVYLKKGEAQYLLRIIENRLHSSTAEHGVDDVNLEHVFPENPSAEWLNAADLQGYEWHLGNLTILGPIINQQAANRGFSVKVRDHYRRSNVELTKQIVTKYQSWDVAAILDRSKALATEAVKIWRVR